MIIFIEFIILIVLVTIATIASNRMMRYFLIAFNVFWLSGLILSNFGFYKLDVISIETNTSLLFSIIIFNIVCHFYGIRKDIPKSTQFQEFKVDSSFINKKLLILVNIIVILVCLPYVFKAKNILDNYGVWYLRYYVYEPSKLYFETTLIAFLFQNIVQPFLQFVLIVAISQFHNFKHNKLLFLFGVIDVFLELLLFGGGRRTIVTVIIALVFFLFLSRGIHNNRKSKQNFLKASILLGSSLIILVSVNSLRTSSGSFFKSFVEYFTGSIIMFDKILESNNISNLIPTFGNGILTFSFIISPISLILHRFGITDKSDLTSVLNASLQQDVSIGQSSFHNAHATAAVYFYCDFGPYFYWIGFVIMGLIMSYFIKNYWKSERRLVLAVYFATFAFYSLQTYPFTGIIQFFFIGLCFLFIKKNTKRESTRRSIISTYEKSYKTCFR